jgi:hypothetical protein
MKEFEKELAILKGRVDGLEARVGELEATQFSTTTKLKGQATFVIGANSFGGDAKQGAVDRLLGTKATDTNKKGNPFLNGKAGTKRATAAAATSGATSFNYDLRLFLDTSFTGKDLLRTTLRSGNFGKSAFGGGGYVGLDALEVAFEEDSGANSVGVNRLFYQFPVGSNFTATVGGRVRQDDMLAVWPSAYPSDTVLDFFTYAGAPAAYNLTLGSGAGLAWESNDFSISANYVSSNGQLSDPNTGGIATDGAGSNGTVQIAYAPENWGLAAAYTYASGKNGAGIYRGNATPLASRLSGDANTNSLGLSAWWSPEEAGWFPSISAGWGISNGSHKDGTVDTVTVNGSALSFGLDSFTSQSWYVGLQWADAFLKGNTLGMAVGQPTFVTSLDENNKGTDISEFVADGNYAWEFWYAFQVTDNITVTPAIYYLSRPLGEVTNGARNSFNGSGQRGDSTFNNFGGLLKTTFKF